MYDRDEAWTKIPGSFMRGNTEGALRISWRLPADPHKMEVNSHGPSRSRCGTLEDVVSKSQISNYSDLPANGWTRRGKRRSMKDDDTISSG